MNKNQKPVPTYKKFLKGFGRGIKGKGKKVFKEDVASPSAVVMAAGASGFSSSASATGPVAGLDPVMKKYNDNIKNRSKKALTKSDIMKRSAPKSVI